MNNPAAALFVGVFPTGLVYADRRCTVLGDYRRCAFLPFWSLELQVEPMCPLDLLPLIRSDALALRAKAGQQYQTTTCGQFVVLGGGLQ